eukprot:UC4_evm7s776
MVWITHTKDRVGESCNSRFGTGEGEGKLNMGGWLRLTVVMIFARYHSGYFPGMGNIAIGSISLHLHISAGGKK